MLNTDETRKQLMELANAKLFFGKYKGSFLIDLPESYLIWFKQNGFPAGKIGEQLQQILEIKTNGLEQLIYPLVVRDQQKKQ
jgi:hypothetical protein